MSYLNALKVKNNKKDISYEELVEKVGDFGFSLPLYNFQVQGFLYLYQAKRAILCDSTGLGKTAQALALLQYLCSKGEKAKWIIVTPPTVQYQWAAEFEKFTNLPAPVLGVGGRRERVAHYISGWWQYLIISYQVLWRDWKVISDLGIKCWIFDDAHFFRHHQTKTAHIVKHLTEEAERVLLLTATPIQKSIMDIHSLLEALGLRSVFGSEIGFENHYCVVRKTKHTLRDGRVFIKKEVVGLRNHKELQKKLAPYFIKRTFGDVGEQLPSLILQPVRCGLYGRQVEIYKQLRSSLIKAWDSGEFKSFPNKGFHSLIQILLGTKVFGLSEDVSVKFDAVMEFIESRLGRHEKVIVYSFYRGAVSSLQDRLLRAGYKDFLVLTGGLSKQEKERRRLLFLENPSYRVLLATDVVELGLNLQSARYLIMLNLILNPQRVVQLVGRLRRLGSPYKNIVVYPFLTKGTIEESLWDRLRYESAINDVVFNEQSDVFPKLSTTELMTLLREEK